MLQRAASNAYSWWWASHIRTKQSKWLEQSLQDMEEKVHMILKLIEQDGDSFAKRAQMYYNERPELLSFVQESFRAYRALAERYDHISTELQNANNTIAQVFPERVQFEMEDDDDDYGSAPPPPRGPPQKPTMPPQAPPPNVPKIPPKAPTRNLKGVITSASSHLKAKKMVKAIKNAGTHAKDISGMTKTQAIVEVDKLQKEILSLQTTKEFIKSSYESGVAKFWEIEKQIEEKQGKITLLQDEFSVSKVIDDDEARSLMAEAALKSCLDSLTRMEEKQEKSVQDIKIEHERVEDARKKINSLKHELLNEDQTFQEQEQKKDEAKEITPQTPKPVATREQFETTGVKSAVTVSELAENIDELVEKVIGLENSVSSQASLIVNLRRETDELQSQINNLEGDKANLINDKKTLVHKIKKMEARLRRLQELSKNVEDKKCQLDTNFTEAHSNLDHLSDEVQNVEPDKEEDPDDEDDTPSSDQVITSNKEEKVQHSSATTTTTTTTTSTTTNKDESGEKTAASKEEQQQQQDTQEEEQEEENKPKTGLDQRETALLSDYKAILQKYEDVKNKMCELEKVGLSQVKELRGAVYKRDEEIKNLRHRIYILQSNANAEKKKREQQQQQQPQPEQQPQPQEQQPREPNETESNPFTMKDEDFINWIVTTEQSESMSPVEEKIRMDIDALLDENLDFWLRFSTQFHQIQKFKTAFQDLQTEVSKLKEKEEAAIALEKEKEKEREKEKEKEKDKEKSSKEGSTRSKDREKSNKEGSTKYKDKDKSNKEGSTTTRDKDKLNKEGSTTSRDKEKTNKEETTTSKETDTTTNANNISNETPTDKPSREATTAMDVKNIRPIYKHMREIQTELTLWAEQSESLKDEMGRRFSSLCDIQDEITEALNACVVEEEIKFTSHQAAKFQGEVLNMKQENNRVKEELLAGLDHVTALLLEIESTMEQLDDDYGLTGPKNSTRSSNNSPNRSRVPLRSFIFGTKPKKKHSIFSLHKKIDVRRSVIQL